MPQPAKRDVSPTFRSSVCIGDPSLCAPMSSPPPRSPLRCSRHEVPEGKATRTRSRSPGRSSSPARRSDCALGSDHASGPSGNSIATACWQRFGSDNGSSTRDFNPCQLPSPSRARCRQQRMSGLHQVGGDACSLEVGGDSWVAWTRIGKEYVPQERPVRGLSPGKTDSSSMRNILQGVHGLRLSRSPRGDKLPQSTQPPWLHLDACTEQSETSTRRLPRHTVFDGSAVCSTLHNDGNIDGARERLLSPRAHCGKEGVRNLVSSIFTVDECSRSHATGAMLQDWQVIHSPRSRRSMNANKNASNGLSTCLTQRPSSPSAGSRSSEMMAGSTASGNAGSRTNEMAAGSSTASGDASPWDLTPECHRRSELRAEAARQWDAAVNPERPANVPLSDRARATVPRRSR